MPNTMRRLPTNAKRDSIAEIQLKTITFSELWEAYPADAAPCRDPATGKAAFSDECAIRVGTCFANAGITNKSFKGACCWYRGHSSAHMLRAEEVADWLLLRPFTGCPRPLDMTGRDWRTTAKQRQGVIFFKDYWLRDKEQIASGDHIDLWNGHSLTAASVQGRINNFLRFTVGLGAAWYSDLGQARKILLWELK